MTVAHYQEVFALKVLAIDLDGVVYDWFRQLLLRIGLILGRDFDINQMFDHDFAVPLGLNSREMNNLLDKTRMQIDLDHIWLVPGAVNAINRLSEYFRIVVITSRSEAQYPATIRSLERDFGGKIREVHLGLGQGNPYTSKDGRKTKQQLAESVDAVCLVEDNPNEFVSWDSQSVQPILYAQPWNARFAAENPQIVRDTWPYLTEYLIHRFA
jgi:hypothetical protein